MAVVDMSEGAQTVDGSNKRVVQRRCPICDRGHMCFATGADIEPAVLESPREVAIGSRLVLAYDTVGSWRGSKAKILAGTTVTVKNLHTQESGDLRAMVELDDGDVYWVGVSQLTRGQ